MASAATSSEPCCPHRSGKRYEWLPQCSPKDTPLDVPPDWLARHHPYALASRSPDHRCRTGEDRATRLPNGERTTGLLRIMGHVISNSPTLDPEVLRELFLGWNRRMCDPPKADREVVEMVENLIVREHNKGKWLTDDLDEITAARARMREEGGALPATSR